MVLFLDLRLVARLLTVCALLCDVASALAGGTTTIVIQNNTEQAFALKDFVLTKAGSSWAQQPPGVIPAHGTGQWQATGPGPLGQSSGYVNFQFSPTQPALHFEWNGDGKTFSGTGPQTVNVIRYGVQTSSANAFSPTNYSVTFMVTPRVSSTALSAVKPVLAGGSNSPGTPGLPNSIKVNIGKYGFAGAQMIEGLEMGPAPDGSDTKNKIIWLVLPYDVVTVTQMQTWLVSDHNGQWTPATATLVFHDSKGAPAMTLNLLNCHPAGIRFENLDTYHLPKAMVKLGFSWEKYERK